MSGLFDQITNYSPPLLTAGQVNYKGTWSAAANSPTLVSPPASTSKGDYYVVSAAGTQFGIDFAVGDWIISNGTAWEKVDLTDAVSSVFGRTGAVTAASGDYTASQVTNVPAGTISSTNVQDAINELSSDITTAQNVLDAYVTNDEAVAITKGQVVYAYGSTGNRMSVKLANNSSESTSSKTIGVVLDASIAAGTPGYIRIAGVIDGLNLGSFTAGQTVYLGATAGTITATKPYAPNHLVYVGIVERANNGNGQLYVKVQNGYELDEIHDVQITSAPASGALLVRDATNSLWKAARLTAGTNIAVTNADASVTVGVTGIIGSSNGGTGNGFTKFSGPTTAEKTFTLPDSNATLLYSGGALGTPSSGTVTNLTGTASININGTVGATTPNTGAFTSVSSTVAGDTITLGASGVGYLQTFSRADANYLRASSAGGYFAFQTGGANTRAVINDTGLAVTGALSATSSITGSLLAVGGTAGTAGSGRFVSSPGSPVSVRTEFGTDGSGWQYRIAKNQAGTITDLVTVVDSSYVGIGTTSPIAKLDVTGSINFGPSDGSCVAVGTTNTFTPSGGSPTAYYGMTFGGFVTNSISLSGYNGIAFYTGAGVERARIDSSGNVGIGVTPSAWAIYDAGTIQKSYGAFWASYTNQSRFGLNCYYNGSWIYSNSNNASIYEQTSGKHIWYTAPSGTAGNAISFTQAMTLDASGNLGIGTSSPIGRFDVQTATNKHIGLRSASDIGGLSTGVLIEAFNDNAAATIPLQIDGSLVAINSLSGGNVGIGTSAPSNLLHLYTANAASALRITASTGTNASYMTFTNTGGNAYVGRENSVGTNLGSVALPYALALVTESAYPIEFVTNNVTRAIIDSSGNVGIGTTGFSSKLSLAGASSDTWSVSSSDGLGINGFVGAGISTITTYLDDSSLRIGSGISQKTGILITGQTTASGSTVQFRTGGSERARIDSSGNLLVGVTAAGCASAGVVNAIGYAAKAGSSGAFSGNMFNINWTGSPILWIDNTNVGQIATVSDYRIKKNVTTQTASGLERVMQLRPVSYEFTDYKELFKADGITREGFIAHEVQEIIPSGAQGAKDEENQIQSLRVDAILSVTVKAIQELNANLVAQVAALSQRLAALEAK